MAWNAQDVFARFSYCTFAGVSTGLSLGLGVFASVQDGERHHGETKRKMRNAPHDKYRWHRHLSNEDVRVFAGNRPAFISETDRHRYNRWLETLDREQSIVTIATGGCGCCGRQGVSRESPSCLIVAPHVVSSCHVVSCRVMSYHVVSRRVVRLGTSRHAVRCRVAPRRVIPYRIESCRIILCRVVSCHGV